MDWEDKVGGERTTRASTASSLKLRRANARRPLTHSQRFIVNADSGCESSTISKSELQCRWDDLFAPGSKVWLIDLADPVAVSMYAGGHTVYAPQVVLLHFMICHSNKCHRPRTSSCHKEQRGGTEYG